MFIIVFTVFCDKTNYHINADDPVAFPALSKSADLSTESRDEGNEKGEVANKACIGLWGGVVKVFSLIDLDIECVCFKTEFLIAEDSVICTSLKKSVKQTSMLTNSEVSTGCGEFKLHLFL